MALPAASQTSGPSSRIETPSGSGSASWSRYVLPDTRDTSAHGICRRRAMRITSSGPNVAGSGGRLKVTSSVLVGDWTGPAGWWPVT